MSRKSKERRKAKAEAKGNAQAELPPKLSTADLKRRRNRRMMFVGVLALLFPILELVAYQFRVITLTFINQTKEPIKNLRVTYPGGQFQADEIKPEGVLTRRIRPDFSFTKDHFSTYLMTMRYSIGQDLRGQMGRVGALDFSATEKYTFVTQQPDEQVQLQHATLPGFPMSLVREVMERLGFR